MKEGWFPLPNHDPCPERMDNRVTVTELIMSVVERIVRTFHPLRILLFGSHAREEPVRGAMLTSWSFCLRSMTNAKPQWKFVECWPIFR